MALDTTFRQGLKEFLWSGFLLTSALILAICSSVARHNGMRSAAVVFAILSLIVAGIVSYTVVPRLVRRVRFDYWMAFRFFRVTRRGGFVVFLLLLIALATFNTGNNLLVLVLAFLLAALLVSGMISNIVLYGLGVSLTAPEAIYAGQTAGFIVTLKNAKKRCDSFALKLKCFGEVTGDPKSADLFELEHFVPFVPAGEETTLRVESLFSKRGLFEIKGFEVRTQFPFGFFVRGRELEGQGTVIVYPALVDVQHFVASHASLRGVEIMGRKGQGSGLYNVRDYQWGDESRFVHWKSSAKLSRLMVKEFLHEGEATINVAFSTYLPEQNPKTLEQFDKGLSMVASLARHYGLGRHRFSLYTGEMDIEVFGRRDQYEELMRYLATVQPASRMLLDPARVRRPAVVFTAGEAAGLRGTEQVDYLQL